MSRNWDKASNVCPSKTNQWLCYCSWNEFQEYSDYIAKTNQKHFTEAEFLICWILSGHKPADTIRSSCKILKITELFHGQRSLEGYGPWGCEELDMTEWLTPSLFSFFSRENEVLKISYFAVFPLRFLCTCISCNARSNLMGNYYDVTLLSVHSFLQTKYRKE